MFCEMNESVRDDRQTKSSSFKKKPLLSVVGLYGTVPGFRTGHGKAISQLACGDWLCERHRPNNRLVKILNFEPNIVESRVTTRISKVLGNDQNSGNELSISITWGIFLWSIDTSDPLHLPT
jgi:hypothetical protein